MTSEEQIKLSNYPVERSTRNAQFSLLPVKLEAPIILSQPIQNTSFPSTSFANNTISLIKGTSLRFEVKAQDPTNLKNLNDTSSLYYVWRKDGAQIVDGVLGFNTPRLFFSRNQVDLSTSGRYVCEIYNSVGVTQTTPIDIDVVDTSSDSRLRKNLLINGDGDGGLDGWSTNDDIIVRPFIYNNTTVTKNYGSFRLGSFIIREIDKDIPRVLPNEFYFGFGPNWTLFGDSFLKRKAKDTNLLSLDRKSNPYDTMDWQGRFASQEQLSQIILNEDTGESGYAGFYPGIVFLDSYNKNKSLGLLSEFRNKLPNYFTRNKMFISKYGDKQSISLSQNVDLSEASSLIDGNTIGVKNIVSQFFAYAGIGITDYKIKVVTDDGDKTFNYYIKDSEDVFNWLVYDLDTSDFGQKPVNGIPFIDRLRTWADLLKQFYNNKSTYNNANEWGLSYLKSLENKTYPNYGFRKDIGSFGGFLVEKLNEIVQLYKTRGDELHLSDVFNAESVFILQDLCAKINDYRDDLLISRTTFNQSVALLSQFTTYDNLIKTRSSDLLKTIQEILLNPTWISLTSILFKERIKVKSGTTIEIIPQCYDRLYVDIHFKDSNGRLLSSERVDGPTDKDIWAVKEKIYLPLTMYSIFQFLDCDNNDILVYGQKYTNTNALKPLFEDPGLLANGWEANYSGIVDKNATFLLNKYDFGSGKANYPNSDIYWYVKPKFYHKALNDYGAAAMFAIGKDMFVPKGTRQATVAINFQHESKIFLDNSPELKGWFNQELYSDEFGQNSGTSNRLIDYGYPRCGITKMKFLLYPNNIDNREDSLSYSIPPTENTVLGLEKLRYNVLEAFDSTKKFTYAVQQPKVS